MRQGGVSAAVMEGIPQDLRMLQTGHRSTAWTHYALLSSAPAPSPTLGSVAPTLRTRQAHSPRSHLASLTSTLCTHTRFPLTRSPHHTPRVTQALCTLTHSALAKHTLPHLSLDDDYDEDSDWLPARAVTQWMNTMTNSSKLLDRRRRLRRRTARRRRQRWSDTRAAASAR